MSVIDDYLKDLPSVQREQLERIRKIVKRTVPEAEEVITYGMPGFKYKTKYLVGFNAFKDHLSFFPASHPIEVLQSKLHDFKLSKGTIQFTVERPIPEALLKELLLIRAEDIKKT